LVNLLILRLLFSFYFIVPISWIRLILEHFENDNYYELYMEEF